MALVLPSPPPSPPLSSFSPPPPNPPGRSVDPPPLLQVRDYGQGGPAEGHGGGEEICDPIPSATTGTRIRPGAGDEGGSTERPGGLDGGGLNDYRGGDGGGDGNTNAMASHQKRVAYKEENALRPGDGGCATQIFPALTGIGNVDRNSLPRICPNKLLLLLGRYPLLWFGGKGVSLPIYYPGQRWK